MGLSILSSFSLPFFIEKKPGENETLFAELGYFYLSGFDGCTRLRNQKYLTPLRDPFYEKRVPPSM